jgi:hypothetical protein
MIVFCFYSLRDLICAQQKVDVVKMAKKIQAKQFNLRGLIGESDRFIGTKMPKHLFSGKSGFKNDRR